MFLAPSAFSTSSTHSVCFYRPADARLVASGLSRDTRCSTIPRQISCRFVHGRRSATSASRSRQPCWRPMLARCRVAPLFSSTPSSACSSLPCRLSASELRVFVHRLTSLARIPPLWRHSASAEGKVFLDFDELYRGNCELSVTESA